MSQAVTPTRTTEPSPSNLGFQYKPTNRMCILHCARQKCPIRPTGEWDRIGLRLALAVLGVILYLHTIAPRIVVSGTASLIAQCRNFEDAHFSKSGRIA